LWEKEKRDTLKMMERVGWSNKETLGGVIKEEPSGNQTLLN